MLVAKALALLGVEVVVGYWRSNAPWSPGRLRLIRDGIVFVPTCKDLRPFVLGEVKAASFRNRWIELAR